MQVKKKEKKSQRKEEERGVCCDRNFVLKSRTICC